jgi:uncharacterized protein YkwD
MQEFRRRALLAAVLLLSGCDLTSDGGGGGGPSPSPPDSDLAQTAVAAHNDVRAHASPAPSPALPQMQWSAEVASVAQQWANHCVYAHNQGRGDLGENIAASSPGYWSSIAGVVQAWASEAAAYDYGSNTCAQGAVCGHYTQLVWRSTTLIGCAYARCTANSPFPGSPTWDYWVCDYSPPGNWLGEKPY